MEKQQTQKEKIEQIFVNIAVGDAYIHENTTTRISNGAHPVHYVENLEVSWNALYTALKFYEVVLPSFGKAGFKVYDLKVIDENGETTATFKVDGE